MIYRWIVVFSVVAAITATVYGLAGDQHEFPENKCVLCHYDVKKDPANIKPTLTLACRACHLEQEKMKSHPSSVYPSMTIPGDMPLTNGKLTCLTCHFVHMKENVRYFTKKHNFLRRQVRGMFFCTICHNIDKDRHLVFDNIHPGSYTVTDNSTRVDRTSLGCIECHDTHIKSPVRSLGAGNWNHNKKEYNHPIGISYRKLTSRKMNEFRPEGVLNKSIRLYNGKIGCGTCHNIYSQEKNMLAMSNRKSRLCLECHIK